MRIKAVAVALGAALALGTMGAVQALPRTTVNLSFFADPASSAGWTTEADGNKAIALSVEVFGWAGVSLNRAGGVIDNVPAPSFDFLADTAGNSGGSPRWSSASATAGRSMSTRTRGPVPGRQ